VLGIILLLALCAIGLYILYVKVPTFGASGLYEYLGLFVWGLGADVAQRTLTGPFIVASIAESRRLFEIASLENRPCLNAFWFPFGAPGEGPPCIRHLPFAIAGDWHGLPLRVRAPQRFPISQFGNEGGNILIRHRGMMAPRQLRRSRQQVIQMAAPACGVLAFTEALGLGRVQDLLNPPAHPSGSFGLCGPDRL
jgi:hypothetical protein